MTVKYFYLFICFCVPLYGAPIGTKILDSSKDTLCVLCQETFKIVQDAVHSNKTIQEIFPVVSRLCSHVFSAKNLNGQLMCPGIIDSYGPVVLYTMAHVLIKPHSLCVALQLCPRYPAQHLSMDQKKLPSSLIKMKSASSGILNPKIPKNESKLTILQFSDVHFDPFYKKGSAVDCKLILCCRPWHSGTGEAGEYGDYNCDLPLSTFDLFLETIRDIDPDIIIYTGDNPPHDLYNQTLNSQVSSTKFIVNRTSHVLKGKTIYPTIGNHETFPESEFLAELPLYQDILKSIAEYWQEWVSFPQEALQTIATNGYYTMKIGEGLRIISINSEYGYVLNFYSFLNKNNSFYHQQIDWVEKTLSQAENDNEKVLLIAHVPPGTTTSQSSYGEWILRITKKYKGTIIGMITGHTHHDEFELIQDKDGLHGVILLSPSVTPYGHSNPSFRVYTLDKSTYRFLDYKQYHLNLTKANEMARTGSRLPQFELSYTATEEYDMPDISPESWGSLVERFYQYDELVQKYYFNKYGKSKPGEKCDEKCKEDIICTVQNIISLKLYGCNE